MDQIRAAPASISLLLRLPFSFKSEGIQELIEKVKLAKGDWSLHIIKTLLWFCTCRFSF